jgi:hypothetical protein
MSAKGVKDDCDEKAKKTAKGIMRSYLKKRVRHAMHVKTLRSRTPTHASFMNFRSFS